MKLIDLTGERFGKLVVLSRADDLNGRRRWLCRCDCGTEKTVEGMALKQGHTKSCGCQKGRFTHRQYNSRTYKSWGTMKSRCLNPKNANYRSYGGRGITICERWLAFEAFLADMGERPPSTSLERRNNDGNYEPGNCHWATQREQMNNTRTNVFLTINGERKTLAEWSAASGVHVNTLRHRLKKGMPPEQAIQR